MGILGGAGRTLNRLLQTEKVTVPRTHYPRTEDQRYPFRTSEPVHASCRTVNSCDDSIQIGARLTFDSMGSRDAIVARGSGPCDEPRKPPNMRSAYYPAVHGDMTAMPTSLVPPEKIARMS